MSKHVDLLEPKRLRQLFWYCLHTNTFIIYEYETLFKILNMYLKRFVILQFYDMLIRKYKILTSFRYHSVFGLHAFH